MNRITIVTLLALMAAVPAGAAGVYFHATPDASPCFAASAGAFRLTDKRADFIVRIDNAAAQPSLRLQIVDDAATADFVLVDDDAANACDAGPVRTVHIDPKSAQPDLTISLSHASADKTIFVKSARFSEEEAAALLAVTWQSGRHRVAARTVPR